MPTSVSRADGTEQHETRKNGSVNNLMAMLNNMCVCVWCMFVRVRIFIHNVAEAQLKFGCRVVCCRSCRRVVSTFGLEIEQPPPTNHHLPSMRERVPAVMRAHDATIQSGNKSSYVTVVAVVGRMGGRTRGGIYTTAVAAAAAAERACPYIENDILRISATF